MDANTVSSNVSVLDLICKDKYAEANNHKRARDDFNKEAKNWVNTRNINSERAKELSKKAAEAKSERDVCNEKVRELKALRDQMHAKANELKEKGGDEYDNAKSEGNRYHDEMASFASKGQLAHQLMMQCYEDADVARKLSDIAHKKFIECRESANREHEAFLNTLKELKDLKNDPFGAIDSLEDDA